MEKFRAFVNYFINFYVCTIRSKTGETMNTTCIRDKAIVDYTASSKKTISPLFLVIYQYLRR